METIFEQIRYVQEANEETMKYLDLVITTANKYLKELPTYKFIMSQVNAQNLKQLILSDNTVVNAIKTFANITKKENFTNALKASKFAINVIFVDSTTLRKHNFEFSPLAKFTAMLTGLFFVKAVYMIKMLIIRRDTMRKESHIDIDDSKEILQEKASLIGMAFAYSLPTIEKFAIMVAKYFPRLMVIGIYNDIALAYCFQKLTQLFDRPKGGIKTLRFGDMLFKEQDEHRFVQFLKTFPRMVPKSLGNFLGSIYHSVRNAIIRAKVFFGSLLRRLAGNKQTTESVHYDILHENFIGRLIAGTFRTFLRATGLVVPFAIGVRFFLEAFKRSGKNPQRLYSIPVLGQLFRYADKAYEKIDGKLQEIVKKES